MAPSATYVQSRRLTWLQARKTVQDVNIQGAVMVVPCFALPFRFTSSPGGLFFFFFLAAGAAASSPDESCSWPRPKPSDAC